jgi:hypothetical protein
LKTAALIRACRRGALALVAALPLAAGAGPAFDPTTSTATETATSPLAVDLPSGEVSPIEDASAEALWWGNFDLLETQYEAVRASPDFVDGGTLRLQWFRVGLARVFDNRDQHDPYYAQLEALTHAWSIQHPRSALARLLYARALYARAMAFRGTDYAANTPAAAMKEFERYLALAEAQLTEHADLLKDDSTADVYLAMFGRWNLPFERLHAIALDSLKRNPRDVGAFDELAMASLPRWGGSDAQFDAVVREAAQRVDGYGGMALYAFLYDDYSSMFEGNMFGASDVDWPTMRQGFRDYLDRHPDAYILNRFALQACLAEDKPTAQELLARIGAKPSRRAWGNRLDACRRWARSP